MAGWLGNILGGIGKLFTGGGGSSSSPFQSMAGGTSQAFLNPTQLMQQNNMSGMGGGGWGKALGGISKIFGGGQGLAGLGMMGLGSMIPNTKMPGMPDEFKNYMGQLNAGGTPGMQSANQYYQNVLSGQNQGAYDAATVSIDENMEEERRKLIAMYKTLRPGTDPSTDSTFQRDQAQLEDRYARNRALAMAGVQQGAASGAAGLGGQLAGLQGNAALQYINQIATQWGLNAAQRQALRDSVMGLGGTITGNAMDPSNALMKKLFGG